MKEVVEVVFVRECGVIEIKTWGFFLCFLCFLFFFGVYLFCVFYIFYVGRSGGCRGETGSVGSVAVADKMMGDGSLQGTTTKSRLQTKDERRMTVVDLPLPPFPPGVIGATPF